MSQIPWISHAATASFFGTKDFETHIILFPPLVVVLFGTVWIVVFLIGRFTSLASINAAIALPIAAWLIVAWTGPDFLPLLGFCVLMAALAIWRHRTNIVRLLNGTENRFRRK